MFCPKCGSENFNTSRFCKKCGKPLPDSSRIQQVAQQPQFPYGMPSSANLLGQVLDGKYRIEAKLGSGGMGDVYRATRLLIGDTVAIKILHAHLARDAQAAERFRREAVTATQLRHKNIVALYDVGISAAHNIPFILMELAEGFSLRQIISQYRVLPLDFVVTMTAQLCSALDEAHRLGIVHRDIKPENIIANQTANGWHVKVLDFGIAKLYNQADSNLTQDGSAMGTPQYMSPEQCLGEHLDGRSDIYSVGILLYEMLAGTVPFKSPVASAVAIHQVQTMPNPPRSLNPNIAPQVEAVVLRTLDKRREMRPQTASQLAQEMIQAATVAFKSGLVSVSATPIPAPNVEPEFDAAGESENSQMPPSSNTLSSEILVENEPNQSARKTEYLNNLPANNPSQKKLKLGKKQKKQKANEPVSKKESEKIIEENRAIIKNEKEDLTLVFADAAYLLDEMFPNEENEISSAEQAVESKPENIQNSQTILMPAEELPYVEDSSSDILAKYQAETVLPNNYQDAISSSNVSQETASPPNLSQEIVSELNLSQESAPPPNLSPTMVEQPLDPSYFPPEVQSTPKNSQEVRSKPNNSKLLVFGGIGVFIFIVLAGLIGFWSLSGDQKTEVPANTSVEKPAPDLTKPPTGMAYIPGGEFMMGSDKGDEFSRPAHKVSVKPFFMDLTEVTNEEYKKFVDAANYKSPPDWKNNDFPEGKAKFPVTGVDWDAANAFAKWADKRLPTEEEWEFAARGSDDRLYPWGNDWKKELTNADNQNKGMMEAGKLEGKSPFGLFDMSGNAWEWTATEAKAYPNGKAFVDTLVEPKIIRGGYWGSSKDIATTVGRRAYGAREEKQGYGNTSFRCVKDVSGS